MHLHQVFAINLFTALAMAMPAPAEPEITPGPQIDPRILQVRASSSEYSMQPQMSALARVPLGDYPMSELISAVSKACGNGCGGFTTTHTATTVPTPQGVISKPTPLGVEYMVTNNEFPKSDYGVFMEGLQVMGQKGANTSTFNYYIELSHQESQYETTTQHWGPQSISFSRWSLDAQGHYSDLAGSFEISITSQPLETADSGLCSDIAGPMSALLGAIPDIGPVFGLIGSLICLPFSSGG